MALSCHRCGNSLDELSLPLTRLDECPACGCQLHVCLMCRSYDPKAPTGCTEDDAIEVRDKKSANFCDYFEPSESAYRPGAMQADQAARSKLAGLFGESGPGEASQAGPQGAAPETAGPETSPAQRALEDAEKLFKN
jgi:hypothetical protein